MKATKVRAVAMVRRIRDRHAKALAGKSAAEIIEFYRAAGAAVNKRAALSARRRRTPANNYQASPRQADRSLPSGRRPKPKKRASKRGR